MIYFEGKRKLIDVNFKMIRYWDYQIILNIVIIIIFSEIKKNIFVRNKR